jgi:hypothetical protein
MLSSIFERFRRVRGAISVFLGLLIFLPVVAFAAQVTVAWDPNTPTPDGYRLYQRLDGQDYDYTEAVWEGTDTTTTIYDLADDQRYYFVVRAYTGAYESGDSNEITFISESTPPEITQPEVTTYSIAAFAGANGSISPAGTVSAESGADQTFTFTADAGYHVSNVNVDGISKGSLAAYTFTQIAGNHTIAVEFSKDTYTIAQMAEVTLAWDPNDPAPDFYCLFMRTEGQSYNYEQPCWSGKGTLTTVYNLDYDTTYYFVVRAQIGDSQSSDSNEISFRASSPVSETYTITSSNGNNGSISPSGTTTVSSGDSQGYTITPNAGYHISNVIVDGTSVGAVVTYSFSNVSADHTISASFAVDTYTLTASAGAHGSISPSGTTAVSSGNSQGYTITPDAGYHVSDVIVDGTSVGAVATYSFSNVSANHTISASFAVDTYTLTASAGAHGSISPSGTTAVSSGNSQGYTITPDTGYHVSDVIVDGKSMGAVSAYTFSNITSNHSISAVFEAETFVITASSNANGDISPGNSVTVEYGASQSFTFTADTGYHIEDVQVDGQSVGVCRSYTFTDVSTDHALNVVFSETTPVNLWLEAEDGDLQWPMEIADDEKASAGGYVWVPEGTGSYSSVSDGAGFAEYTVDLPEAGEYVIWGRQVSNNGASDSFFVSIDGQPEIVWHTRPGGEDQWTWDAVSIRDAENPDYACDKQRFLLSSGQHTLRISQREDGTKLDKLLITNQTDLDDPEPNTILEAMEFGEVEINHKWFRVNFEKTFNNPVVVAGPISLNGGQPAVIRITNVDPTGFEIRIQEWVYLDGSHVVETVSYMVMEAGSYSLPDGTLIEANTIETQAASSYEPIGFSEGFNVAPIVMTSLTSFNDAETVTGRIKQVTIDGFSYRMREQESNTQDHLAETLSYIAWEPSLGTIGDVNYNVGRTADAVTHKTYSLLFDTQFASPPTFLADMQTTDGGDTANVRCKNKAGDAVEVLIDEEQSRDSETGHTTEVVGFIALEQQ